MSFDRNIGWLAGGVDGEGHLLLQPAQDKRIVLVGRKSLYIKAALEIENTSEALIVKVMQIYKKLGIPSNHFCKTFAKTKRFKAADGTVHNGDKGYHRVTVSAKHELQRLLETLQPELTAKVGAAAIVMAYLNRACQHRQYKADIVDLELCRQLKELQGRRGRPFPMQKWVDRLPDDRLKSIDGELIPCQAVGNAYSTTEGVETRTVSSVSNNRSHECPAPYYGVN